MNSRLPKSLFVILVLIGVVYFWSNYANCRTWWPPTSMPAAFPTAGNQKQCSSPSSPAPSRSLPSSRLEFPASSPNSPSTRLIFPISATGSRRTPSRYSGFSRRLFRMVRLRCPCSAAYRGQLRDRPQSPSRTPVADSRTRLRPRRLLPLHHDLVLPLAVALPHHPTRCPRSKIIDRLPVEG